MAHQFQVATSRSIQKFSDRLFLIIRASSIAGLAFIGTSTLATTPSLSVFSPAYRLDGIQGVTSNKDQAKLGPDVLLASLHSANKGADNDYQQVTNPEYRANSGAQQSAIIEFVPQQSDIVHVQTMPDFQALKLGALPANYWLSSKGYLSEVISPVRVNLQLPISLDTTRAGEISFDKFVLNWADNVLSSSFSTGGIGGIAPARSSGDLDQGQQSALAKKAAKMVPSLNVQNRDRLPNEAGKKNAFNAATHHTLNAQISGPRTKKQKKKGPEIFGSIALASSSASLKSLVSTTTGANKFLGHSERDIAVSWQNVLSATRRLDKSQRLERINSEVNKRIRYRNDFATYGRRDYWASPVETIGYGQGDCEDFAILKMWLLTKVGFQFDNLHVVVVESPHLSKQHAVLSVRTKQGTLILDSLSRGLKLETQVEHYRPIFSTNGTSFWLHGFPVERRFASNK